VAISLFSQVSSNRTRVNGLKWLQRRFRSNITKNFFTKRVAKYWNTLSKELVESPSLEVFKRHVDMVLTDRV